MVSPLFVFIGVNIGSIIANGSIIIIIVVVVSIVIMVIGISIIVSIDSQFERRVWGFAWGCAVPAQLHPSPWEHNAIATC